MSRRKSKIPVPKRSQKPKHSPEQEARKMATAYGSAAAAYKAVNSGLRNMRPIYALSGYLAEKMYGVLYGYMTGGRAITLPHYEWIGEVKDILFRMMGKEVLGGE